MQENEVQKSKKTLICRVKEYFVSQPSAQGKRAAATPVDAGELLGIGVHIVLAFFLGRTPLYFDTYPLGIALICAVSGRVGWSAAGFVLGSLSAGHFVWATSGFTAFLLRLLICSWLEGAEVASGEYRKKARTSIFGVPVSFSESLHLRTASACVSAFLVGIYNIVSSGYTYVALYGAIFSMVAASGATVLYFGYFDNAVKGAPMHEAGAAALLFTAVFALSSFDVFGISAGFLLAYILTLCIAKSGGVLRGTAVGLVSGIALGLDIAPILGITGFCSGLVFVSLGEFAPIISMAIFLIGRALTGGFWALVGILPEIALGSCIIWPLVRYDLIPKTTIFSEEKNGTAMVEEAVVSELSGEERNRRIKAMSESFARVSSVLYTLSDRLRRPSITELRRLCDRACDKFCPRCMRQSVCWDRELSDTLDMINKLTSQLNRGGRVSTGALPPDMVKRCRNIEEIVDEINYSSASMIETAIKSDKTEIFALDYEAVSKLLENELTRSATDMEEDASLSVRIRESLRGCPFPLSSIGVYGKRRKIIIAGGVDGSATGNSAEKLRAHLEEIVGCRFRTPEFNVSGSEFTVTVSQGRKFRTEFSKACIAKENEDGNGDTVSVFENREDYFYTLISDGMGSGSEALLTSKLCSIFSESMLSSGNSKTLTLEMLNSLIRAKGLECSSTVDLFELDLLSGSASFIKSGAAPSFIRRGGNIFRIQSKTMPVGIMRSLDAEEIDFDIQDGDVVIMVSDGISQNFEEGLWLLDLLGDGWVDDLDTMTKLILDTASLNNPRTDDATVCLIRIREME